MNSLLMWVTWLFGNLGIILDSLIAVGVALVALFMVIPGDQPEKAIQGALDWLKKFSKK